MSIKQEVETRRIGFAFQVSVEKEVRVQGADPKYTDKLLMKACLEGNAETYEQTIELMKKAKTEVLKASEV